MTAAKDSVENIKAPALRDAALIANGNIVEHYEMALYGTLAAFAQQLGLGSAVGQLKQTLNEEKAADAKLSEVAINSANVKAARAKERRF